MENIIKEWLMELIGDDLGIIIDPEGNQYPGIFPDIVPSSDLEYRGVIAMFNPITEPNPTKGLNNIKYDEVFEVHLTAFEGVDNYHLKIIWDKIKHKIPNMNKVFLSSNEQYGQTGKLILYIKNRYVFGM